MAQERSTSSATRITSIRLAVAAVVLGAPVTLAYMFDKGKDDYIATRKYGGAFEAILDEPGAEAPKIISLSQLGHVTHGAEFERWVLDRYQELPVSGYDNIYVRKQ